MLPESSSANRMFGGTVLAFEVTSGSSAKGVTAPCAAAVNRQAVSTPTKRDDAVVNKGFQGFMAGSRVI